VSSATWTLVTVKSPRDGGESDQQLVCVVRRRWYRGIFVDEAASPYSPLKQSDCLSGTTSAVIYYQTISAYVHAEGVNQTVTLNYGANPVSAGPSRAASRRRTRTSSWSSRIPTANTSTTRTLVNHGRHLFGSRRTRRRTSQSSFTTRPTPTSRERSVRRSLSRTSASPTPHPVAGGRRPRRVGISRVNLTAVDTTLKVAHMATQ